MIINETEKSSKWASYWVQRAGLLPLLTRFLRLLPQKMLLHPTHDLLMGFFWVKWCPSLWANPGFPFLLGHGVSERWCWILTYIAWQPRPGVESTFLGTGVGWSRLLDGHLNQQIKRTAVLSRCRYRAACNRNKSFRCESPVLERQPGDPSVELPTSTFYGWLWRCHGKLAFLLPWPW